MKGCITAVALAVLLVSSVVQADTVFLANSGKVAGTIVELRLRIGPLSKVFARAEIKSVKGAGGQCEVTGSDGTKYVGVIDSVVIKSVAGVLTFGDKSVLSVELGGESPRKVAEKPAPTVAPVPAPAPDEAPVVNPGEGAKPPEKVELTPEQKKRLQELLKTAATLRDEYLKKVDEVREAEYGQVKEKYGARWLEVCAKVEGKKKEFGKYADQVEPLKPTVSGSGIGINIGRTTTVVKSGAASVALDDMNAAEAEKNQLRMTIETAKNNVKSRGTLRAERVRAYYYAIYRYLLNGKEIPEEEMKKIYEKTLGSK